MGTVLFINRIAHLPYSIIVLCCQIVTNLNQSSRLNHLFGGFQQFGCDLLGYVIFAIHGRFLNKIKAMFQK